MSRRYKTIYAYNDKDNNYPVNTNDHNLAIKKTRSNIDNTTDPRVWGPSLWLFLHISSANYVYTLQGALRMKNFIISLPYTLPCTYCSEHAKKYVGDSLGNLDTICSSTENLFKFFVDFHNYVNQRHNKRVFSYEEAWNMYHNGVDILDFSFCDC